VVHVESNTPTRAALNACARLASEADRPIWSAVMSSHALSTPAPVAEDLRRARRWLLAIGLLALLGGVVAVAVPVLATITVAVFIGWILVLAGGLMAFHAFAMRSRGRVGLRLLASALTLFVGVYLLVAPLDGALTLTVMLAFWFAGVGALMLAAGIRLRGLPGAGLMIANGVISLILAILIAVDLPGSREWAIGLLVGINLMFWGVRALVAASLLKELEPGPPAPRRSRVRELGWTS
jgi:uncharacterized membrane protein HdeD (DUF308 family)